jgi:RNA polymerase sigma-70 factor (ECF subfamily)
MGDKPLAAVARPSWTSELAKTFEQERGFLLRLAHAQLRDPAWADDVVQETALAAWQAVDGFEGRSTMRTWLVGILRFKILDALRQRQKHAINFSALELDSELQSLEDELLFDAHGRWRDIPQLWGKPEQDPVAMLQEKQGMALLQLCLQELPEKTAQIFLMREYLGLEGVEIAQKTGLQAGHVRVILLRARLALRTCLEWRMAGQTSGSSA